MQHEMDMLFQSVWEEKIHVHDPHERSHNYSLVLYNLNVTKLLMYNVFAR